MYRLGGKSVNLDGLSIDPLRYKFIVVGGVKTREIFSAAFSFHKLWPKRASNRND